MRFALPLLAIASLLLFFACQFTPSTMLTLQVNYDSPPPDRQAGTADKFNCYVVSATSETLKSDLDGTLAACLKLGKMSSVADLTTLRSGVSLNVPAGENLTLRLFGIETTNTASCSNLKLSELLTDSRTKLYELGREQFTAFRDSEIEIRNTYIASSNPDLIAQCQTSTVLTLTKAYQGASTGIGTNPTFNELISDLPPVAIGSPPVMTEILILSDIMGTSGNLFSRTPSALDYMRLDLLYQIPTTGIPTNGAFRVKISAEGGLATPISVECPNTASIFQGSGYRIETVINTSSDDRWDHINGISTSSSSDFTVQTLDLTPIKNYIISEGGNTYFHLSVRSQNKSEGATVPLCSALRIRTLDVAMISSREDLKDRSEE